ncbi:MAG: DUF1636 domain-containing protein [Pseudomonadota bacterium]
MLTKTDTAASIVVCSTCRLNDEAREDETGKRGGALFAEAVRAAAARRGNSDIHIEETACFFACSRYCTVHIRDEGKISYVLGDFRATEADAEALLDYFEHYLASKDGVVPYGKWPEGVKGHFITRQPPAGRIIGK